MIFSKIFRFIRRTYTRYKLFIGIGIGFLIFLLGREAVLYTSTDLFCNLCHVHPRATYSWKKSTHYKNESGVVVHCVECHLPPDGIYYLTEKIRLGIQDIYGKIFVDTEEIDWEVKSELEYAFSYTYDSSCLKCHDDLYSLGLSPKGVKAHEHYMNSEGRVHCINCHISVGHFQEKPIDETDKLLQEEQAKRPQKPPDTGEFHDYAALIPGTDVTFNMIAIPGGEFIIGSPESEPFRGMDEAPQRRVKLTPFWMGETEVTWREFEVFYAQTATREKKDKIPLSSENPPNADAVTGPTPPYGAPDQGWGKGLRPAITMTHYTAKKYCEWLSMKTGKNYRLPTESEWEYACSAGTTGPYYFDGSPRKLTKITFKNRLFGTDDTIINKYVWHRGNSNFRTQPPYTLEPNPWGLYNMLGNVKEFCLDWYAPDTYSLYPEDGIAINPRGPATGTEHVIRGGSYNTDPAELRISTRDHTYHDRWMLTDPQSPKSKWWYSDSKDVGFRVVREYDKIDTGNEVVSNSKK